MFLDTRAPRWIMRALLAASMLLLMVLPGRTQTPQIPNLSGNWELVQIDSNPKKNDPKFPNMTLVIEQESFQLKVTEKRLKRGQEEVRTFVYHADGSGETNTGEIEVWRTHEPRLQSITRTAKNRIVTEYKREWNLATTRPTPDGIVPTSLDTSSQSEAEWSLDASGNKLTLTTKALNLAANDGPRVDFGTIKLKFRKI